MTMQLAVVSSFDFGDAREVLCGMAAKQPVDLLVVGSRGLGALQSYVLWLQPHPSLNIV